jgi:hypothetical protein
MSLETVIIGQRLAERELYSAMPDAPVLPHRAPERPRLRRSRVAVAAVLHRAAARVAPAPVAAQADCLG